MGRQHSSQTFHMLPQSPWPILTSFSSFLTVSGIAFFLHKVSFGGPFLVYGLFCLIFCVFGWFSDIMSEATLSGFHTKAVSMGLRLGFLLFMVSEIMLFFGFFWAFFHASLCPSMEIGGVYPPMGISPIPLWEFPLFNTFLLITSGISMTWAHRAVSLGSFKSSMDSLALTVFLGFFFVILQMFEYYEAPFCFNDSVYACSFYMLTGLHGCHVFMGALFIAVCLIRLLKSHFMTNHYLGLVFAMWYWHFVDAVWIFLFVTLYCWGNWTVPYDSSLMIFV